MDSMTLGTWMVVAAALASVVVLLRRPGKTTAELLFAVFCGSLAVSLLRPGWESAPAWAQLALAVGGCATCNVYWLVARALFRGEGGVLRQHLAAAALIAVLIVGYRVLKVGAPASEALAALGAVLSLASSTVLVLAFLEAVRGFGAAPEFEQRLRIGFMAIYGGCVLMSTLFGAVAAADPAWQGVNRALVLGCVLAILAFTHVALELRRRQPQWLATSAVLAPVESEPPSPCVEDQRVAAALLRALEVDRLYCDPELKVAGLARHVGRPEHRVSRVITQVLGARNFNQLINRYRIQQACHLLRARPDRSVLEISLDAGFASLGPFNRAFKAATGCTPTAWRASADGGCDVSAAGHCRGVGAGVIPIASTRSGECGGAASSR